MADMLNLITEPLTVLVVHYGFFTRVLVHILANEKMKMLMTVLKESKWSTMDDFYAVSNLRTPLSIPRIFDMFVATHNGATSRICQFTMRETKVKGFRYTSLFHNLPWATRSLTGDLM